MLSWPPARTATVPVAMLARCAAASMPRASPDTTTRPAAPRSRASFSAILTPAAEALREPTMAIIGWFNTAGLPRTASSGGASSMFASCAGYSSSPSATRATPILTAAAKLARGFLACANPHRPRGAAPPGEVRQRLERRTGAAAVTEEHAEGARPDVLGTDQAQPVEAVVGRQFHCESGRRGIAGLVLGSRRF